MANDKREKKRSLAFIALLLLLTSIACGQNFAVQGKITDSATGKPIAGASVFLSNTSIGTASDNSGEFRLRGIPQGGFTLVVSSLGYQTFTLALHAEKQQGPLLIILSPRVNELSEVTVGAYDKDGWQKWGKLFADNFIGTSAYASQCTIKNTEALKFHFSQKRNFLQCFADEPLLIENKALGYLLHYKLEGFSFDFNTSRMSYLGFPLFEELNGDNKKQKKWAEQRKDAYFGSITHFMRCLYTNKLSENGYEVRSTQKSPNTEKTRILTLRANFINAGHTEQDFDNGVNEDTANYYNTVLAQPDEFVVNHKEIVPADSIAAGWGTDSMVLKFNNYLTIRYKNKKAPYEYWQQTTNTDIPYSPYVTSQIRLLNGKAVYISPNGAYHRPQDIYLRGYWGWNEKIFSLLPFDYWP